MKIVTAAEMREIDRLTTEQYGVPSLTLMENAGTAVAEFAQKHFEFGSVCVVCGKGNNGGDGFVAARKLKQAGKKVSVIVLAKSAAELRGDAAAMFKKLKIAPLWVSKDTDFKKPRVQQALRAELIVDAILGTGFKPPLKGIATKAVEAINALDAANVLAIDIPSGVDSDSLAKPHRDTVFVQAAGIVSFTAPKAALVYANLTDGPIAIAPIGSPVNLVVSKSELNQDVITTQEFQALRRKREPDSHKGTFGHVLVIGGSVGKAGAAAMAGLAALRSGAGLVTVACPRSVQPTVAAVAPELMTEGLDETSEGTVAPIASSKYEDLLAGKSLVIIGPGMSRNVDTAEFIRDFVRMWPGLMVIDADALNAFEGRIEELQSGPEAEAYLRRLRADALKGFEGRIEEPSPQAEAHMRPLRVRVLTPHPGELSRLLGVETHEIQANRIEMALRAANQSQCTVVLKGHRTVVASPSGYVWINCSGNPGMAKGGSGDVLSGVLGGVLAQYPHMMGWVSWTADLLPDKDIHSPAFQGIFGWVAMQKPRAEEIQALQDQFTKSQYAALREKGNAMCLEKVNQLRALMGPLHVSRAVFLHGLAGDIARGLNGEDSMIATDIIHSIGDAFDLCERESRDKFVYIQR